MNTNIIKPIFPIEFTNRYKTPKQQSPDKWAVGIPQIGQAIALYTYARYTGDSLYEKLADELVSQVSESEMKIIPSLGLERTLCCLGCGFIYLLRNGFIKGNEDEILADLDERLFSLCLKWDQEEEEALCGWIHYLTLRIDTTEENATSYINQQNLIHFLDRLGRKKILNKSLLKDIGKIDALGIFPKRTQWLLNTGNMENQDSYKSNISLDSSITFVIPVRIDSSDRQENLKTVLDQLSKRKQSLIIVLEADIQPIYELPENYPNVKYIFVKDDNPVFHRTKYLNMLLREAKTSIVGIWDTDVIIEDKQIDRAIADIREGKAVMSFPYDGRFNACSLEDSMIYRQNRSIDYLKGSEYLYYSLYAVGGAFFVKREIYQETGGENEHFYGWGIEDDERIKRMEIMGLPISRINGPLYHLYHPRKENSWFYSQMQEEKSREEFLKVCKMRKEQLRQYIDSW